PILLPVFQGATAAEVPGDREFGVLGGLSPVQVDEDAQVPAQWAADQQPGPLAIAEDPRGTHAGPPGGPGVDVGEHLPDPVAVRGGPPDRLEVEGRGFARPRPDVAVCHGGSFSGLSPTDAGHVRVGGDCARIDRRPAHWWPGGASGTARSRSRWPSRTVPRRGWWRNRGRSSRRNRPGTGPAASAPGRRAP